MSWQTCMDDHLMCDVEGNRLTSAAILGQDGSVWSQSSDFPQGYNASEFRVCKPINKIRRQSLNVHLDGALPCEVEAD